MTGADRTLRIDAHHHFWRVDRGDYHWMPDEGPLHHDYGPTELLPLLAEAKIDGTILVQAAQTDAETDFLRDLARAPRSPVVGVVAWVDLDLPSAPQRLEDLAGDDLVVAVRPMLQDLPDDDWITRPAVADALRLLPELGLAFEVLSYPRHLPHVLPVVDKIDDLDVVIDHLSKPTYTDDSGWEHWRHWMKAFANRPRVHCKLSGMVTEIGPRWSAGDVHAHTELVIEEFGPDRTMFGSDWPVCLQVATYADVVELAETVLGDLSPTEQAAVSGGAAARFYGLGR